MPRARRPACALRVEPDFTGPAGSGLLQRVGYMAASGHELGVPPRFLDLDSLDRRLGWSSPRRRAQALDVGLAAIQSPSRAV